MRFWQDFTRLLQDIICEIKKIKKEEHFAVGKKKIGWAMLIFIYIGKISPAVPNIIWF